MLICEMGKNISRMSKSIAWTSLLCLLLVSVKEAMSSAFKGEICLQLWNISIPVAKTHKRKFLELFGNSQNNGKVHWDWDSAQHCWMSTVPEPGVGTSRQICTLVETPQISKNLLRLCKWSTHVSVVVLSFSNLY